MANKKSNSGLLVAGIITVVLLVSVGALYMLPNNKPTPPYTQYQTMPLARTAPQQYLLFPNSALLRHFNYRMHITVLSINDKGMINQLQGTVVDQNRRGVTVRLLGHEQVFDREAGTEVMVFKLGHDWKLSTTLSDEAQRLSMQQLIIRGAASQIKNSFLPVGALDYLDPALKQAVLKFLASDISVGGTSIPLGQPGPLQSPTPRESV